MTTSVLGVSATSPRARVHGVAEALPPGERVLWEGAPQPRALARHLLLVRPLAAYFTLMVSWWVLANVSRIDGTAFWGPFALQLALVAVVIGGAHGLASLAQHRAARQLAGGVAGSHFLADRPDPARIQGCRP